MTTDEIIDGVLQREGGWRDQVTRPDGSIDPATNKGITFPVFVAWRQRRLQKEPVTLDQLRQLSDDEAAQIYYEQFVAAPGFIPGNVPFEPLRVQLIDFGINSGPATAVRWLQRVLGMDPSDVDGIFGPKTRDRLALLGGDWHGFDTTRPRLINDALVAARSYMIDRAVDQGIMRKQDEEGVESRALSFFLAVPSKG